MKNLYLGAGVAGLLVFLLGLIPAPLLHHWSGDDIDPQVQIYGLQGSLWRGEAAAVNFNGIRLHSLQWQLRPLSLLFLRLSHDVTARTDGGEVQTIVSKTLLGTVRLGELKGSLPVEQLGPALQLPVLPLSGRLVLALDKITLRNGWPTRVDGSVLFKDLLFSFASPPAPLGSHRGQFVTAKDVIRLDLTGEDGELMTAGFAEIANEGKYTLDIKVRARANASAAVTSLLQSMGRPDAEGWYSLRHAGVIQLD
jgi:general secretion pathway protein N